MTTTKAPSDQRKRGDEMVRTGESLVTAGEALGALVEAIELCLDTYRRHEDAQGRVTWKHVPEIALAESLLHLIPHHSGTVLQIGRGMSEEGLRVAFGA